MCSITARGSTYRNPPANFFRGATFRPRTIGITGNYRF
jgi:hypothetical protein